ncbi:MAG: hypothetical protein KAR35_02525, partial [Candidatus Heimdallarchaeota archaeon]|nr:hypothetical protein [Candidatus Heimdallarchaeota archaeon]MCK5048229.1 hypothetical protein [Candidatus Heimdallarchaeota archaeon]
VAINVHAVENIRKQLGVQSKDEKSQPAKSISSGDQYRLSGGGSFTSERQYGNTGNNPRNQGIAFRLFIKKQKDERFADKKAKVHF